MSSVTTNKFIKGLFITGLFCIMAFTQTIKAQDINSMTAKEIYQQSVNIFTHANMQFIVDSSIEYAGEVSEKRAFKVVTKKRDENNSNVLLRFIEPVDLKCTAILLNKEQGDISRFIYFPSLKRVRVVPESDKQKEVLGMGISFAEMTKPKGSFEPVLLNYLKGKKVTQLTLLEDDKKTIFLIDPETLNLLQIEVFEDKQLTKRVEVFEVKERFAEKVITQWKINDFKKKRLINYQVRVDSIVNEVDNTAFYKNRLKRCNL